MTQKIAIITGASRGLGRSMALHLAHRGVGVIGTYLNSTAEAETLVAEIEAAGGKAAMLKLDVSDTTSFPAFAASATETLKTTYDAEGFDHLVNNAGEGVHAPVADATEAQFDQMIDMHLRGPLFLTQALLPLLNDGGRILNVSTAFTRTTMAGFGLYAAAKAGLETLTRFMAVELGARRIRVNAIAPGAIATDFGGGGVRDDKHVNAHVAGTIALGRVGQADDIGGAVAAILSDDLHWANGTTFDVSGGQSL
ncbi:SDR family oxidoreductase [Sphingomonas sp. S-NIH.Pt15_0812]|uniref:SDR family NAD(P)-dependent oxidoreductase n=1 Tax=Sphingomonas sp. S-NIH.Pt15_0812 TaxID=1920129 RepID=UPI000F7DD9F6|nr:SDR family oxidoreductase [Sphingomonas sp. S-NIH.Pt15_0812]RSU45460.1 3-oxoacyl-ACP reductase [Sphingomonas sp. S-NIH.Pt15_0812]